MDNPAKGTVLVADFKRVEDVYDTSVSSAFARPLLWQLYSLMRRSYTNTLRAPDFLETYGRGTHDAFGLVFAEADPDP